MLSRALAHLWCLTLVFFLLFQLHCDAITSTFYVCKIIKRCVKRKHVPLCDSAAFQHHGQGFTGTKLVFRLCKAKHPSAGSPAVQEQGQNVDAVAVVVVFPWLNHLSLKKKTEKRKKRGKKSIIK